MACLSFPLTALKALSETEMISETLTTKVGKLEERVKNHITFFWSVVAFHFLCLGGLLWLSIQTKNTVNGIAKIEANAPAQIVASLLNSPSSTSTEVQTNLAAAASVLQTTKIGKVRPDLEKLKVISQKLVEDQNQYPELPQVWETTGAFINYKSVALLPADSRTASIAYGIDCSKGRITLAQGMATFKDCEVSLDDHLIRGSRLITFVNCVIHYRGGDIPSGQIEFYGSIFHFDILTVPPPRGAQMMRDLASAESMNEIKIAG